jgi:hypothetical protein
VQGWAGIVARLQRGVDRRRLRERLQLGAGSTCVASRSARAQEMKTSAVPTL